MRNKLKILSTLLIIVVLMAGCDIETPSDEKRYGDPFFQRELNCIIPQDNSTAVKILNPNNGVEAALLEYVINKWVNYHSELEIISIEILTDSNFWGAWSYGKITYKKARKGEGNV